MTRYVVDACVVVKWLIPETFSLDAARLLDDTNELIAPDLLIPEVGNVLWKKIRLREITLAEGGEALALFQSAPVKLYECAELLEEAFKIANTSGRSIYDCFYLALAIQEKCQMVTADEKLCNALHGDPLAVHLCWIQNVP
jgi:predicted nucleic acid-binding protein